MTTTPESTTTTKKTVKVFGVERDLEDANFPTETATLESLLPHHGGQHGWFTSSYRGKQLHYRKWRCGVVDGVEERAIVVFMHGILTHAVKYVPPQPASTSTTRLVSTALMVDTFLRQGISVYAFDQYGHGYSEGTRFFIPESYQVNVTDYIAFCQTVVAAENNNTGSPIFLMGESYGCTVTLHGAKYFQDHHPLPHLDSLILTAPAVIGDLPPYPVVQLLKFLGYLYPTWRPFFMPNPVSSERVWSDPNVQACYRDRTKPANIIDGTGIPYRLGTGVQLLQALQDARTKVIPELTTPFLVIHGTHDYGVPIQGSEFLYQQSTRIASHDKRFLRKEGAYHDLLAEPNASEIMDDILQWINERLALRAAAAASKT